MRKRGYSNAYGSAVSAASSLIAPIMPPSIALIIYGLLTDTSIGKLFLGGVIPALVIAVALMLTVRWTAVRMNLAPARESRARPAEILSNGRAALWALAMPVMLLLGLRSGWFTPTELGAVAAVYAFLVGIIVYRGLTAGETMSLLTESALTTAGVMFIVASASVFSLILSLEQVPQHLITTLLSVSEVCRAADHQHRIADPRNGVRRAGDHRDPRAPAHAGFAGFGCRSRPSRGGACVQHGHWFDDPACRHGDVHRLLDHPVFGGGFYEGVPALSGRVLWRADAADLCAGAGDVPSRPDVLTNPKPAASVLRVSPMATAPF
jgi:hypothetical protein